MRYRFRPGWITTLVFIVLLPVLIGLGFWQLERAGQKTELRDRYTARGRMEPVDVNRQSLDAGRMDLPRAGATGRTGRSTWTTRSSTGPRATTS